MEEGRQGKHRAQLRVIRETQGTRRIQAPPPHQLQGVRRPDLHGFRRHAFQGKEDPGGMPTAMQRGVRGRVKVASGHGSLIVLGPRTRISGSATTALLANALQKVRKYRLPVPRLWLFARPERESLHLRQLSMLAYRLL
jgi:hypothetical protein